MTMLTAMIVCPDRCVGRSSRRVLIKDVRSAYLILLRSRVSIGASPNATHCLNQIARSVTKWSNLCSTRPVVWLSSTVEFARVVVNKRIGATLCAIAVVALVLPLVVASVLSAARLGMHHDINSSDWSRTAEHPQDWPELTHVETWIWLGGALVRLSPGSAPDCHECDVALWQLRAGWPLRCMEASWQQDYREAFLDAISGPGSPFETTIGIAPRVYNRSKWETGFGVPKDSRDEPGTSWLPVRPLPVRYGLNSLFYLAMLCGASAATIALRHRLRWVIRRKRFQCTCCGYSMMELPGRQCPECGAKSNSRTAL